MIAARDAGKLASWFSGRVGKSKCSGQLPVVKPGFRRLKALAHRDILYWYQIRKSLTKMVSAPSQGSRELRLQNFQFFNQFLY